MSSFYALVILAECWGIQILTIRYFNSFGFFGTYKYIYSTEQKNHIYTQQVHAVHDRMEFIAFYFITCKRERSLIIITNT